MMMNNGVLSNLMSSNGCEVSASSSSGSRSNNNSNIDNSNVEGGIRSQPFASSATQAALPPAKKRGHPGSPDPDTEVIALSPKSLLATNRFVCEICNKGFQRDQNLQLHRRGHNLPWKLKQRSNKDVVKKKVYVCPETTCAHHDPSRALGDLTGVKKHFCRKHGEKKWKCEKCSKRYAVQSDWKAHSKICGTREYRCDCGTVFSRRDSFTTHRAFCDALAHEGSSRSTLFLQKNPLSSSINSLQHISPSSCNLQPQAFSIKTEQESLYHDLFNTTQQEVHNIPSTSNLDHSLIHPTNPNPTLFHPSVTSNSPHMSATALLQRAAQMGATMSNPSPSSPNPLILSPHHQISFHQHQDVSESGTKVASFTGMVSPSCGEDRLAAVPGSSFFPLLGLEAFGIENEALNSPTTTTEDKVGLPNHRATDQGAKSTGIVSSTTHHGHFDHNRIMMMNHPRNIDMPSSQQAELYRAIFSNESGMMNGMMNALDNCGGSDFQEDEMESHLLSRRSDHQGMTRDFLGLRALSSVHEDLVKVAGFDFINSSSSSTTNYKNNNNNHDDGQHDKDQYQSHWQN